MGSVNTINHGVWKAMHFQTNELNNAVTGFLYNYITFCITINYKTVLQSAIAFAKLPCLKYCN